MGLPNVAAVGDAVDHFLKRGGGRGPEWAELPASLPLVLGIACGAIAGAAIGGYHGVAGDRFLMLVYAGLKVPLLFGATLLLAVPAFYVLNLVFGVGDDFREVWAGLADYQLSVSIQLLALTPVTLLLNLTMGDYRLAQAWSTLMFAYAAWAARRSLSYRYRVLVRRNPVHARLRVAWFVLYAFVGVQFGWVLRPFLGHPDRPVEFLRDEVGNAYVEVARVLVLALRRLVDG